MKMRDADGFVILMRAACKGEDKLGSLDLDDDDDDDVAASSHVCATLGGFPTLCGMC